VERKELSANRYLRQTVLPEIGTGGQERLRQTRILCVGAGGLGCPALLYLAAAGIGKIGIIDADRVDISNLQRQVLFRNEDQGKAKVTAAKDRLLELNPEISVETHEMRFDAENAFDILNDYDMVIDGTDNFSSKYLINDAAVMCGLPVIYGSVTGFEGYLSVFSSKLGPCYRCIYPAPPASFVPNCAEAGVIGALTGIIGSMQALEAIKLAVADDRLVPLIGKLLIIDAATMATKELRVLKNPQCPICSATPSITELREYEANCLASAEQGQEISAADLAAMTNVDIIDVREQHEWDNGHIIGARHIPLSRLQHDCSGVVSRDNVSRNKIAVVYCQSGVRSKEALSLLVESGHQNVKHLTGGMMSWTGPVSTPV